MRESIFTQASSLNKSLAHHCNNYLHAANSVDSEIKHSIAIPDAVIQLVMIGSREVFIVRDDLLPGGTKQRGLVGALEDFTARGKTHFVYVSPFCGYAQLALSYLCREMNLTCELFCERDPRLKGQQAHEYTLQAELWGAKVHLVESLAEGARKAAQCVEKDKESFEIPLGFDCEEFFHHYCQALTVQWERILMQLPQRPATLWVSVGSGTLLRCFQKVLKSSATQICGVNVHVLRDEDPRISQLSGAQLYSAPHKFAEPTGASLGFPSNCFYDAKVIPFLQENAKAGDVFWNVGR